MSKVIYSGQTMLAIRIFFLFPLMVASLMPVYPSNQGHTDKILKTIEEKVYYYPQQAETLLDSLMHEDSLQIKKDRPGELAFLRGFMAYHKGDSDKALNYMDTALLTFISNDWPEGQAKCYLLMGWITEADNFQEQAMIYYYETIRLLKDQSFPNTGLAYLGIARCKKILHEPNEKEFRKGIKYLLSSEKKEFLLYAKFANYTVHLNDMGNINQLLKVAKQYKSLGLNNNVSTIYKVLANHYYGKHQLDSAHLYIDKAILSYDNSYPGESLVPAMHQMKGLLYSAQKNFGSARDQYELAIILYKTSGQDARSAYAYNSLYHLDLREGNYKSAVENLSKANDLEKVTDLKEKQRMAKLMEITSGVNMLNLEITKVKKERRLMLFTSIFLFVLLIIVMTSALNIYRIRVLKKSMMNAELQLLLSVIVEKQLSQKLIENISHDPQSHLIKAQSYPIIEEVYPQLFKSISKFCVKLSESERRFVFMLAIGISHETIAKLLNIEVSSIRKIKQRVRAKLNLDKKLDLQSFFQGLIKY